MAAMPRAEFDLWRKHYEEYGLDTDRVIWTAAKSGSAMCHALGAKITADALVPKFAAPAVVVKAEMFSNWLASTPGVTVRRCEFDPTGD